MRNKSKAMLGKLASVIKGSGIFATRHWPTDVLSTLEKKYNLTPKEMLRL
jgi:hypothetical protein